MKTLITIFLITLSTTLHAQKYQGSTTTAEQKLNEEYCSGFFNTTDGTIIDIASNQSAQGYLNILDWLQGRVSGLQVYPSAFGTSVPVIRGGVPGIFIDEIQVSSSTLSVLNVNDIAIIKIIKTPFYGGFNCGHGAIAIYTKGDEVVEEKTNPK